MEKNQPLYFPDILSHNAPSQAPFLTLIAACVDRQPPQPVDGLRFFMRRFSPLLQGGNAALKLPLLLEIRMFCSIRKDPEVGRGRGWGTTPIPIYHLQQTNTCFQSEAKLTVSKRLIFKRMPGLPGIKIKLLGRKNDSTQQILKWETRDLTATGCWDILTPSFPVLSDIVVVEHRDLCFRYLWCNYYCHCCFCTFFLHPALKPAPFF